MNREDADTKMCCINAPARAVTPVVWGSGKWRGMCRVPLQRAADRLGPPHDFSLVFTSYVISKAGICACMRQGASMHTSRFIFAPIACNLPPISSNLAPSVKAHALELNRQLACRSRTELHGVHLDLESDSRITYDSAILDCI